MQNIMTFFSVYIEKKYDPKRSLGESPSCGCTATANTSNIVITQVLVSVSNQIP